MDQIRKDYIVDRYVIIASKRADRPDAFPKRSPENNLNPENCPFCPGNEHLATRIIREEPKGEWQVRLIPNKFPALKEVHNKNQREEEGLFIHYPPHGYHEILIETPDHEKEFHKLSSSQIGLYLKVLAKRYKELKKRDQIVYVTAFKNEGRRAGASIGHSHSQIVASSIFPQKIAQEMEGSEKYYRKQGSCPYCDVLKIEKKKAKRIVWAGKNFTVLSPYAPIWPYETWILPHQHQSEISGLNSSHRKKLAKVMKKLLMKYSFRFGDLPYDITYHSFPPSPFSHFHIEIYPRLKTLGGFEYFGLNVNEIPPEKAAKELKMTSLK